MCLKRGMCARTHKEIMCLKVCVTLENNKSTESLTVLCPNMERVSVLYTFPAACSQTHTHTHTHTHTQSSTITHAVNHCKLHCRKLTRYTQYTCYCTPPGALKGVLRCVLFPEYAVSLYLLPVVSLHLSLRFCWFVSLHLLSASTHLSVSSCLLPFLVVFMLFLSLLGSPWDISLYHSLCVFHHPSFLYF